MSFPEVFLRVLILSCSVVIPSPILVNLQSKLPENPIEDPASWAWGLHPDDGLGYKARDSLSLEVCLANPELINTAKCSLPLDLCLKNKEFTPLVGCSGHKFPLSVCLSNPVLITRDNCAGNKYPEEVCEQYPQLYSQPTCSDNLNAAACASIPSLTMTPQCRGLLDGYQATLFQCQDNTSNLCSLKLCDKHAFLVDCGK